MLGAPSTAWLLGGLNFANEQIQDAQAQHIKNGFVACAQTDSELASLHKSTAQRDFARR